MNAIPEYLASYFKIRYCIKCLHGCKNGHCATFEQSKVTVMKKPMDFKRLFQYFIQGLIILAPVTITGYFIYWLFTNIDSLLMPVFKAFYKNPNDVYVPPGLGFIIIISFVLLVGYLSSFFVVSRLLSFFDHWLEKAPGIKIVYSFVKDFSEAFAGKKRKFKKAVLVSVFHPKCGKWVL